ncbi:MAG: L-serine ammonia-lyase, iron-sulfur-dependent, subunit alpha [Pseudoflavonifractor capillosus]|uniref:L-cysteine desulfidase family protein n=1 Tax=Pseudoflavonifractor capillosus TaxID=106588 RepID=UPI0023F9FA6B|nr:L-serine ammonia-lyase, iron-sulfur-dependent, subunit alpha [Pseudoflavonifractor capillosus]MCI5928024.1 L-serine ammonia-lyase, iron-sulfur-dependent, subunit alpha [Pseudoflavonifractor capillosus]MDY4662118.1 L-serine ammonia-lyase, iron-sulfur-dependent, subunit alpha [Pseudoflavonifractor capillosus]
MTSKTKNAYLAILQEELRPAVGCTEPLSVAYAAALMRRQLGTQPERIKIGVSGNILKNVKSVIVPNSGGLRGIQPAVAMGIVAGDPDAKLQVIAKVPPGTIKQCKAFLKAVPIEVYCLATPLQLDILIHGYAGSDSATVRIALGHTNLVYLAKNDTVLLDVPAEKGSEGTGCDQSALTISGIVEFARSVELDLVRPMICRQIQMNSAIAQEGLKHNYGSGIGKLLLSRATGIEEEAMAYAAAGSDARMGGCSMPVVILSGSGNQGLTASVPVILYAQKLGANEEELIRALLVASLTAIHLKTGIGKLSAYCGAVSAGAGAGAGIAFLKGADTQEISGTVSNTIATLSGMLCDGAKASCAAKIAMAVRAGIMGYELQKAGGGFRKGDGIVGGNPEATIQNVGVIAREGMRETDRVVLGIMLR